MADNNTAVYGIYQSQASAERAVDALVQAGFTNNDISVLMPDQDSTREFAHENSTKAPEGAATGAATGGALGGTLGLLAGIGALAIPGVGPLIAAGPIVGALAGLGAGGAVGGVARQHLSQLLIGVAVLDLGQHDAPERLVEPARQVMVCAADGQA